MKKKKSTYTKNKNNEAVDHCERIDKVKWSLKSINSIKRDGTEMILMMKEVKHILC